MDSIADKLQNSVLQSLKSDLLISSGEKMVVAVSGGADSVCLLHILSHISSRLSLKLHIAHLNHQLRGKASEEDASYVSDLAKRLHIEATIAHKDVNSYRLEKKISLEEAARELRYTFISEVLSQLDAAYVAVAHTRDDNVETILLHILRGSGISGLRGLQSRSVLHVGQEKQAVNIVRPLLQISRAETAAYCKKFRLKPRLDASNLSLRFSRNRIRHDLIPTLKTYNPGIEKALLRLASIAAEETAFIEELTSQIWGEIVKEQSNLLSLDIKKLSLLDTVIQKQLLRWTVRYLLGDAKDLEAEHVQKMLAFMKKPAGKTLHLPHKLQLHRGYQHLVVNFEDNKACPLPLLEKEYKLIIPGCNRLPGWQIKCDILDSGRQSFGTGFTADLDLQKSGSELIVRTRRRGDTFQPLGMQHPKKLQRFMSDAKIPLSWRDRVPLICRGEQIIWVAGWRIADSVKLSHITGKILRIRFERT